MKYFPKILAGVLVACSAAACGVFTAENETRVLGTLPYEVLGSIDTECSDSELADVQAYATAITDGDRIFFDFQAEGNDVDGWELVVEAPEHELLLRGSVSIPEIPTVFQAARDPIEIERCNLAESWEFETDIRVATRRVDLRALRSSRSDNSLSSCVVVCSRVTSLIELRD